MEGIYVLCLVSLLSIPGIQCNNGTTGGQTGSNVVSDSSSTTEKSPLEKGISPLFDMTHGFLDLIVKDNFFDSSTGAFTYKDLETIIEEKNYGELQRRWQDIFKVWGGLAACIIIGLLFFVFLPIVGCINCCCFCCCKRCGKARSKMDPRHGKCARTTCCSLLFVFATLMLAGCVVSLISNEVLHRKLENVDNKGTVGMLRESVKVVDDMANLAVKDIKQTAEVSLDSTVGGIVSEIKDAANSTVDKVSKTINASSLLALSDSIGQDAKTSFNNLDKVKSSLGKINELNTNITNELAAIKTEISNACTVASQCSSIPYNSLSTGTNFSTLSDLETVAQNVGNAGDIINQTEMARDSFDKVKKKVMSELDSTINDATGQADNIVNSTKSQVSTVNDTVQELLKEVNSNINPSIDDLDTSLKKYGDYWWYGGMAVPCVVLVAVLCYFLGILFGVFGERGGRGAPCCNRGAGSNLLCCGVAWSYIFSSIIMLIVILTFLLGGTLYFTICRVLNKGVENIEKYEVVLNDTVGLSLQDILYPGNPEVNLTLGSILKSCKNDDALYTALQLKHKFDLDSLLDISSVTGEVNKFLGNTFNLPNITIIPTDLQSQLEAFKDSGIATINFTSYDAEINADVVNGNIDTVISSLESAAKTIEASNSGEAAALRAQATALGNLKQNQINDLEMEIDNLNTSLHSLKSFGDLGMKVSNLIEGLNNSQNEFNANSERIVNESLVTVVNNIVALIEKEINSIKNKVENDIAKCANVYRSVQLASDSVCVVILDPFNGFWFGLGWAMFCIIPCIIFALCLANLYQREEPYDKTKARRAKSNGQRFDDPDIDHYNAYNDQMPLTNMRQEGGYRAGGGGGRQNGNANYGYNNQGEDQPGQRRDPRQYQGGNNTAGRPQYK